MVVGLRNGRALGTKLNESEKVEELANLEGWPFKRGKKTCSGEGQKRQETIEDAEKV